MQYPAAGEHHHRPAAGGRGRAGGGRGGGLGRWHWDSPTIVSPHAARRLYFAGERVYRSDNRGDSWTAVSADLTRNLDRTKIPIMGKVWPADSVAYMEATTRLSTITALDESPLLEGLLYVGTDDGLIQVSEDGGKTWRKVESSALTAAGAPEFTYVTDVQASPRDAQYRVRDAERLEPRQLQALRPEERAIAARRGRRSAAICRQRSGAWSIVQDAVNPNLLFVGMEFGLYATVDGGAHWVEDGRRADVAGARYHDPASGKGTSSPARSAAASSSWMTTRRCARSAAGAGREGAALPDARRVSVQRAGACSKRRGATRPIRNPAYGALMTYSIGQAPAADASWRSRSPTIRASRSAASS